VRLELQFALELRSNPVQFSSSAAVNRRLEFVVASLLLLAVIVLLVFFRYDGTVPAAAAVSVDSFPAGCRRCLAACGFGWPVVSQFEYTLDRTDRQTNRQTPDRCFTTRPA